MSDVWADDLLAELRAERDAALQERDELNGANLDLSQRLATAVTIARNFEAERDAALQALREIHTADRGGSVCPTCGGTGAAHMGTCPDCGGSGVMAVPDGQ